MADKISLDPQHATFISADSAKSQPAKTTEPVYPFLEDADTLALQTQSDALGQPEKSQKPKQVKDSRIPSLGPLGVFLLIVLGLVLIALVCTSAYLFLVNPERLLEFIRGISSSFNH